jgi:hypothetical protein
MRISLCGADISKLVSAGDGSMGRFKVDHLYDLVRVHLLRVGCPRELSAAKENRLNMPVVVEKNRHHYGQMSSTNFYPEAVVVCGEYRRAGLLAKGILDDYGWVERGSVGLADGDEMRPGTLVGRLSKLIESKMCGIRLITAQSWPLLMRVFPFERSCVFQFAGKRYGQAFALDAREQDVRLLGEPVILKANSPGDPQTGDQFVSNRGPLAFNQTRQWGGVSSDLVGMMIRNTTNVDSVVANLLSAIRNGLYKPMKPDFAPVNLSDAGKVLGPLVEAQVSPADFIVWADQNLDSREFSNNKRKSLAKNGHALPDGSFPIENLEDLKNAKMAIGRAKDPAAARRHINKRARELGAQPVGA